MTLIVLFFVPKIFSGAARQSCHLEAYGAKTSENSALYYR